MDYCWKSMKRAFFENKWSILTLTLIMGVYLAGAVYSYDFTVDDAHISLRYADNLVNHGKLSFNPGDEPSEGYTNFLLVLIEAAFIKLQIQDAVSVPKVLGVLAGIMTIIFTYKISVIVIPKTTHWLKYLAPAATAVSTPFVIWSVGGLETVFFTSLIIMAVWSFIVSIQNEKIKYVLMSDFFFFLAALTRPEGVLFWGLTYVFAALNFREFRFYNRIKSGLIFLGLFCLYLIWKYFYFGDILPMTFYVKGTTTPEKFLGGAKRFLYLLKINLNFVYLFFFAVAAYFSLYKNIKSLKYVTLLSAIYAVYVFSQGYVIAMDDVFRFYVPFLPLFYVAASAGVGLLIAQKPVRVAAIMLPVFILAQGFVGIYDLNYCWNKDHNFGSLADDNLSLRDYQSDWSAYKDLGLWVKYNLPSDSTVAISDIGAFGYYSGFRIIDTWSLVTEEIVLIRNKQLKHPKNSTEYRMYNRQIADFIFSQKPELIIMQPHDRAELYEGDQRMSGYTILAGKQSLDRDKAFVAAVRNDMLRFFIRR